MNKISWQAPEYIYREKNSDWYWIVGIVTVSIALISIILNNLIFAILILISSFTLSLFASKKPKNVTMEISEQGVVIDKTIYNYEFLDSFWVETKEAHPRIIFKSKKVFMPFLTILILKEKAEEIKRVLSQHLPEEEHSEPFLEKLLIYFGF